MVRRTALLALFASTFAVSCAQLAGTGLVAGGADSALRSLAVGIPTTPGAPDFGQQPVLQQDPSIVGQRVPITFMYTSDIHSRVEPFAQSFYQRTYAGKGGFARLASMVKGLRQSEPNPTLLDSGDYLQGTPYYNFFKGEVELRLMDKLKYDAITIGNHEFDSGMGALRQVLSSYRGRVVTSNMTFAPELAARYAVFKAGNLRVGVFGLMAQVDGLIAPPNFLGARYYDPVVVARAAVAKLRKEADVIVCISHVGTTPPYSDESVESTNHEHDQEDVDDFHDEAGTSEAPQYADEKIAAQVQGINVILSGHTHMLVKNPKVVRSGNWQTYIVSAGFGGGYLGKANAEIQDGRVVSFKNDLLPVNAAVPEDPAIAADIAPYKQRIDGKLKVKIGEATDVFKRYGSADIESTLNNLIADATLAATRKVAKIDFAISSSGTPRSNMAAGPLTLEDAFFTLPFDNKLAIVQVRGDVAAEALRIKRRPREMKRHAVSNVTYALVPGTDRIKNIMVGGEPLDPKRTYTIAVTDYMAEGGSGFAMFIGANRKDTGIVQRDALINYIREAGRITPEAGRISPR
ncbi:MAG: bifunctional metallophosphatase/5'-nucleotidase [Candidatus Sericytochromatia bacterium]|nr:bifunctional metallophosphatase/5'-nucleotidase [Candidatus Tanganyikabacteria bacterium]